MTFLPNPQPSKGRSRYPRWTLRDGTRVRIEDMSDLHLKRAIQHCETKARDRWPAFATECYSAIGFAPDSEAERMLDQVIEDVADPDSGWEVCLHPMYEHLVAEAERRGLEIDHEQP